MANRFVAERQSANETPSEMVGSAAGLFGPVLCGLHLQGLGFQSPWPAQVVINAPIIKIGNKPKTTAQTTKAETIKMSCLHKADRPIGYLKE
jgi:hypothetical protein